jgi:integrative and conjugative element protein (TIGR02256 family)
VKLLLPVSQIQSLKAYLRRASARETGGLLMGEQLAPDEFRVAGFSFSRRSGSIASFTRDMRAHQRTLEKFFRKTGRDFRRFNYLGEWHSHPHFPVIPSGSDVAAMQAIVNDRAVGATFATLLIVRLRRDDTLEIGPYLFIPGKRLPYPVECVVVCEKCSSEAAQTLEPEELVSGEQSQSVALAPREDVDDCGC